MNLMCSIAYKLKKAKNGFLHVKIVWINTKANQLINMEAHGKGRDINKFSHQNKI